MTKHETILTIHLQQGAKKTEIDGIHDDHIKIKVNSLPVDEKANSALICKNKLLLCLSPIATAQIFLEQRLI